MGNQPSTSEPQYEEPNQEPPLSDVGEKDSSQKWKKRLTKPINRLSRDFGRHKARPVSNAPAPPILIYTPPTPVRSNTDGEEQSAGTPDRTSDEVPVLDIQKAPRVWRIRIERAEFTGLALPQDSRGYVSCRLELEFTDQIYNTDLAPPQRPVWTNEFSFEKRDIELNDRLIIECTMSVALNTILKGTAYILHRPQLEENWADWFPLELDPSIQNPYWTSEKSAEPRAKLFIRSMGGTKNAQDPFPPMPANEVQTVTLQESGPPTPRPDSPPVVFPPPPPPTLSPRPLYARRSRPVSIWSPQRYSAPQWGPRSSIWAQ